METLPQSPITRLDVVLWFLRVQLWLTVAFAVSEVLPVFPYLLRVFTNPLLALRFYSTSFLPFLVSLLVLGVFPRAMALGALGRTERDSVVSVSDWKPLVARCVGLLLFVQSMGRVILYSLVALYSLATTGTFSTLFKAPSGLMFQQVVQLIVVPWASCFLGFLLAFGPAIRDAVRAR